MSFSRVPIPRYEHQIVRLYDKTFFKEWEDEQMFLKAKKLRSENPE